LSFSLDPSEILSFDMPWLKTRHACPITVGTSVTSDISMGCTCFACGISCFKGASVKAWGATPYRRQKAQRHNGRMSNHFIAPVELLDP
jgi:hypothetical protein